MEYSRILFFPATLAKNCIPFHRGSSSIKVKQGVVNPLGSHYLVGFNLRRVQPLSIKHITIICCI